MIARKKAMSTSILTKPPRCSPHAGELISRRGRFVRIGMLAFLLFAYVTSCSIDRSGLPGVVLCPLRATTGLSCPSCGFTRSFVAMAHGEMSVAAHLNVLSMPVFAMGILLIPLLFFELMTRRDLLDRWLRRHRASVYLVLSAAIVFRYAMAFYWR